MLVEAKDFKEHLYQCNDIQVKAELALESTFPRPIACRSIVPSPSQIVAPGGFSSTVPPPPRIVSSSGQSLNMSFSLLGSQGAQAHQRTTHTGQVSCNNNGTYTITFTPSPDAGYYDLSVTINGQHIKDSPKSVTVGW